MTYLLHLKSSYQMYLYSSPPSAVSFTFNFTIPVAVRLEHNSSAFTLRLVRSCSTASLPYTSQSSSGRYNCLISRNLLPTLTWTALRTLPLTWYSWDIIPTFHVPLFFSSPLIIPILFISAFFVPSLWLSLHLSLNATKYSCFHIFNAFSSHWCTNFCLLNQFSVFLPAVNSIRFTFSLRTILFAVKTFNWASSSA